jgi:multiple sugar transport system permease protein
MIIPNVFYSQPLCVFLLTTYFCALPFELEDAAKMDGYTPLQIFWRVILPISTPGLFSAGIFAFLGSYGEFMLASIVTEGYMNVATVPIGVLRFSQSVGLQWTRVSAAIMLSLIPVIVIVLVFQKWVIRGLSAGSVKY